MSKQLKDVVEYSTERIAIEEVDLSSYVSTSNLLQDKQGKINADKLPPQKTVRRFSKGDILVSNIRPYLKKIWFAEHSGGCSSDILVLRVKGKDNPKFIYYSILRDAFFDYVMNGSKGTKMPRGDKDHILKFPIPDYKKGTQNEIAHVLSNIDKKIKINNKINSELKSLLELIYKYWFVQFEFPDSNGKPYKSSGGKMIYNEELQKKIPANWDVSTLADWIKDEKNGDWGKKSQRGNYTKEVTCIRGTDLNGLNGDEKIDAPKRFIHKKNTHKILDSGDIIIEMSGGSSKQSTGRLSFVTSETQKRFEDPLVCSNFCKAITLKDEKLLYNFVYLWNRLYEADFFFGWEGKTSGIKNLLFDSLISRYKTVKPPKKLVNKFYKHADQTHKKIQSNLIENKALEQLRDWLLPMLINGQVKIEECDTLDESVDSDIDYSENKPTNVDYFKRIVLAAEIVWQLHKQPTLGHLKLQKLIYLAQQSNNMNLPTNFLQQAAGPYDPRMARSIDKQLKKKNWFEYNENEFFNYKPLENAGEHREDFDKYFSEEKEDIQYLIDTFKKAKSSSVEVAATLFACWKELLESDKPFSEELLIEKFYNWSEEKAKYEEERLRKAISWMREKGIVPAQELEMSS